LDSQTFEIVVRRPEKKVKKFFKDVKKAEFKGTPVILGPIKRCVMIFNAY